MTTYFGFAVADSMFTGDVTIVRRVFSVDEARQVLAGGVVSCCNPSHTATIAAMRARYGLTVAVPDTPPRVCLAVGDRMLGPVFNGHVRARG